MDYLLVCTEDGVVANVQITLPETERNIMQGSETDRTP